MTKRGEATDWLLAQALYEGDDCLIWPFFRDPHCGRGKVQFEGRLQWANRAMCILVHGQPPSLEYQAAHNCGKGHEGCITPKHLEWKTHAANQRDRRKHGTYSNGRGPCSLSPEQVAEIRLLEGIKTQVEIGELYGVHFTSIGKIFRGETWTTDKPRRRRTA